MASCVFAAAPGKQQRHSLAAVIVRQLVAYQILSTNFQCQAEQRVGISFWYKLQLRSRWQTLFPFPISGQTLSIAGNILLSFFEELSAEAKETLSFAASNETIIQLKAALYIAMSDYIPHATE